ncbi:hypothetical protein F5Y01DRAFT_273509, partial [Xylaria sp. FL0043]
MKKNNKPVPDDEADEKIERFKVSRHYSLVLCWRLSGICHLHTTHAMYFNLDTERGLDQTSEGSEISHRIEFHLAVQRSDIPKHSPVWLKATPVISVPLSQTLQADQHAGLLSQKAGKSLAKAQWDSVGATFCLGELQAGMDFRFQVGKFDVQHPDPRVNRERRPVTLSEWIKTNHATYPRIRLARLIAEVVLKFDSKLWRWTDLEAENLLIVPPLEYEHVESHIGVSLEHQKHQPPQTESTPMRAGEVFIHLGITFLEIAYQTKLERPSSSNSVQDESCPTIRNILGLANDEKLQNQMGDKYADVVRFCLSARTLETDLRDRQMQRNFYKNVIGVLRQEEEYQADSFEELAKIDQELKRKARETGAS